MSDKTELKHDSINGMGGGTSHEKGPVPQDIDLVPLEPSSFKDPSQPAHQISLASITEDG